MASLAGESNPLLGQMRKPRPREAVCSEAGAGLVVTKLVPQLL